MAAKNTPVKKPTGRPTAYNAERHRVFIDLMKQGNFLSTASAYVGVNSDTIYAWFARGEKGEEPFKTFLDDYKKAKPTIEVACVNILADTIVNSEVDRALRVATARHLLKARYPAHWDKEPVTAKSPGRKVRRYRPRARLTTSASTTRSSRSKSFAR